MSSSRMAALSAVLGAETTTMTVVPWRDPVVERVGHDACGEYVELFWLGTLGPTSTWLLRRLAVVVVTHPDGFRVHLEDLALAVGLGADTGPTSSLGRALSRLVMFGLAHIEGRTVAVRAIVPPLPFKQLARLPDHVQEAHAHWSDYDPGPALALGFACGRPVDLVSDGASRS